MNKTISLPLHKVFVSADEYGRFDPHGSFKIPLMDVKVETDRNGYWDPGMLGQRPPCYDYDEEPRHHGHGHGHGHRPPPPPPGPLPGPPPYYTKREADNRFASIAQGELAETALQPSAEGYATAAQGALADTALQPEDVVDCCDSDSTEKPASAASVKRLKDLLDELIASGGTIPTLITSRTLNIGGTEFAITIDLSDEQSEALASVEGVPALVEEVTNTVNEVSTTVNNLSTTVEGLTTTVNGFSDAIAAVEGVPATVEVLEATVNNLSTTVDGLAPVASSGSYVDLGDKPLILSTEDVTAIVDAAIEAAEGITVPPATTLVSLSDTEPDPDEVAFWMPPVP